MMRFIYKSIEIPMVLREAQAPMCTEDIDRKIYSNEEVKSRLKADQYGKCAYCERTLNGDYGDVEHFRPKRGYTISDSNLIHRPGYVWLSYTWPNLLLSCSECNSSFKRNHFDLRHESGRNISGRDISLEEPLLINPVMEDPAQYIAFDGYILTPRIIDGKASDKGVYTIETLGLNSRSDLVSARREAWSRYCRLQSILADMQKEKAKNPSEAFLRDSWLNVKSLIAEMHEPWAQFSAMFNNQLRDVNIAGDLTPYSCYINSNQYAL